MGAIIFFLVISSQNLWAAMAHDQQTWVQMTAQGSFKEGTPWGWFAEIQPRYSEGQSHTYETLLRPGVSYNLNEWGVVTLGYMQRVNKDLKNIEDRVWQQWVYRWDARVWRLVFRWRQEQRNVHAESNISHRTRWLVRAQHLPIQWKGLTPFVACELLYNWNAVSPALPAGLHQSRNFIGVNYAVDPRWNLDLAYMAVITNRGAPQADSNWTSLWLSANFNF